MKDYLNCWISVARTLFSQALAGEPQLSDAEEASSTKLEGVSFVNALSGQIEGRFTVSLDAGVLEVPLLGEGVEQSAAWEELLREVAEAAAGELLARTGLSCRLDSLERTENSGRRATTVLRLRTRGHDWNVTVCDELKRSGEQTAPPVQSNVRTEELHQRGSAGVDLLLDVELEASLRFGSREMSLGEVLELGPGDIVELDRHISDPVDLIVGDKIVAKGDVVLVNGNFGLRVTEVAAPQRRLESIRCLF